ncbi:hypothetical protein ACFOLJ_20640 [Rugamonas sp. CCM 8940]|uniref:hypothetical protein n=1 Tax=Rugamonas sp. CCM 8940 TaxID=2765359 RepID=UPI0018F56379|nr:hypothetical protein [Rugamonas sp. CCM 8940]MBJ7311122.1 hypothetical protein [Rugamonas sp. CCM 8940]
MDTPTVSAAQAILDDVRAYLHSKSNLPVTEEHATVKLLAKSFDAEEIRMRRAAFSTNGEIDRTAVLANYELLHGVKYLDRLINDTAHEVSARAAIAIFRGAEICLNNLVVLARRVSDDVQRGNLGDASLKIGWANRFQETLYSLSQLLVQMDQGDTPGDSISIRHSAVFQEYLLQSERMHAILRSEATERHSDLGEKDLDDPQRFVFFHTFVNSNYESIWLNAMERVRLPGVKRLEAEEGATFYQRIIQNEEVREAVTCVDLNDPTCLMQFRAYHQISEVLVGLVNEVASDVIVALLADDEEVFAYQARSLGLCSKLLQVVTDNIRPIVRTLSPKAYFAIRPALGITSGSHSHNLRKGLFLTIYPSLAKALRLQLAEMDEALAADDGRIQQIAVALLRQSGDPRAEILRHVVYMHQYVRTWRDEHIQFVKTQIGVSPADVTPTASISGAENAAVTANGFRQAHKNDPIAPLYEALLGKPPVPPLPIVHKGGFDEHMAHFTAVAVQEMYADVQARAQRKRPAGTGY